MSDDDHLDEEQSRMPSINKLQGQHNYPTPVEAFEQAKILLGSFLHGEAANPEIYVTAVA